MIYCSILCSYEVQEWCGVVQGMMSDENMNEWLKVKIRELVMGYSFHSQTQYHFLSKSDSASPPVME